METEAEVKRKVKNFLKAKGFSSIPHPVKDAVGFYHMPVPYGIGASLLDFTLCYRGRFAVLETKATGNKPTPRQQMTMALINSAGGYTIWGDTSESCIHDLELWMSTVDAYYALLARQNDQSTDL
jgi:hypothetical protein